MKQQNKYSSKTVTSLSSGKPQVPNAHLKPQSTPPQLQQQKHSGNALSSTTSLLKTANLSRQADLILTNIGKINPKQMNVFKVFKGFQQVKLMIRPKESLVLTIQSLQILFQVHESPNKGSMNNVTKGNGTWQQLQLYLSKFDLLTHMKSFQHAFSNNLITLTQLREASEIMIGLKPEEPTTNKQQWNYEMELLHTSLIEITNQIINFGQQYYDQTRKPQCEEEIELPQNLDIVMEHLQTVPKLEGPEKKVTPRTILKTSKHNKTSSSSNVSGSQKIQSPIYERPQTSAGFHTPEKNNKVFKCFVILVLLIPQFECEIHRQDMQISQKFLKQLIDIIEEIFPRPRKTVRQSGKDCESISYFSKGIIIIFNQLSGTGNGKTQEPKQSHTSAKKLTKIMSLHTEQAKPVNSRPLGLPKKLNIQQLKY